MNDHKPAGATWKISGDINQFKSDMEIRNGRRCNPVLAIQHAQRKRDDWRKRRLDGASCQWLCRDGDEHRNGMQFHLFKHHVRGAPISGTAVTAICTCPPAAARAITLLFRAAWRPPVTAGLVFSQRMSPAPVVSYHMVVAIIGPDSFTATHRATANMASPRRARHGPVTSWVRSSSPAAICNSPTGRSKQRRRRIHSAAFI